MWGFSHILKTLQTSAPKAACVQEVMQRLSVINMIHEGFAEVVTGNCNRSLMHSLSPLTFVSICRRVLRSRNDLQCLSFNDNNYAAAADGRPRPLTDRRHGNHCWSHRKNRYQFHWLLYLEHFERFACCHMNEVKPLRSRLHWPKQ